MSQNPNVGGDNPGRSAAEREFDTVELNRTVPVVPADRPADQVLSSAPSTVGGAGSFGGQSTAGGSAQQSGDRAQQAASQVAGQVQQTASQVADQAQEKAGQVVDQAKQTVTAQAASRKDTAVETLQSVAQAIRQTGDGLRGRDQGTVAGYADTVAERVESVAQYLQGRDVGQLVGEAERYARRNPALFLGGAFALGLIGARFLKSSSRPDYGNMGGQYGQSRGTTYRPPVRYQPSPYRSGVEGSTGSYVGSYRTPATPSYGGPGSGRTGYGTLSDRGGAIGESSSDLASEAGEQFSAHREDR